ncbi:MAG TPA: serine hydrolase domain-containing protein [Nitrosospira sp.]|nr:serine hydrolase domain-containing protein [Nitrosospira sp.]
MPLMFHAFVRNGKVISQTGKAITVPWWNFSKTVIATAALVLVRDKLLSLDKAIENQPFTLRQLLRHQAGLPDYGQLPDYHLAVERNHPPWPDEEMLARANAKSLRYPPGSGWAYSNIGYLYVRHLIELEAGEEFEAALRRLVLRPLGLNHVRLGYIASRPDRGRDGERRQLRTGWVYHGLLVGPLHEAALLLDRLMARSLLPGDLLTAMLDSRRIGEAMAGRPWISPGYGLGIMAGKVEGGTLVAGHTGSGPGNVIAVYRNNGSPAPLCCAAFSTGGDAGSVEREAIRRIEH